MKLMSTELQRENAAIRKVRGFFYELNKSFFLAEPDPEKVGHWRQIINSLTAEAPSLKLGAAARQLSLALDELELNAIKDEYYELFFNPFSPRLISWTASVSVNGRNFGPKLVEIRQLMAAQGLEKEEKFKEPEDSLPILLDLMARLIEMEADLGAGGAAAQLKILEKFLLPLTAHMNRQLQADPGARLYPLCADFLQAWLEFDESYFV